jgi:hypothetical protein
LKFEKNKKNMVKRHVKEECLAAPQAGDLQTKKYKSIT